MSGLNVPEVVSPMRAQFDSGRTRSYTWRVEALKQAKKMVTERSDQLAAALASDLGKTTEEATTTTTTTTAATAIATAATTTIRVWRTIGVDEARSAPLSGRCHAVLLRGSPRAARRGVSHQPVQLPCQSGARPNGERHHGRQRLCDQTIGALVCPRSMYLPACVRCSSSLLLLAPPPKFVLFVWT